MLIRSQNKISLVKFENIVININNINGKEIICWSQMNPGEDEYISLGNYSTKAKAMKVLDMIQEAYMDYKSGEIIGSGLAGSAYTGSYDTKESVAHGIAVLKGYGNEIRKSILFQMPEDSEVEV
jgi:hypothetical protein|nr:MAG TPA: hypothetical protein [Caudoviricetes sp.]